MKKPVHYWFVTRKERCNCRCRWSDGYVFDIGSDARWIKSIAEHKLVHAKVPTRWLKLLHYPKLYNGEEYLGQMPVKWTISKRLDKGRL